jgi:AbiV family abortive infection protein
LTIGKVAEGMNIATNNAARLAGDARLLLSHRRWPSAACLAALSIEEAGKVVILRRFLTSTESETKALWKEYRTHTKKNLNWILPDLVAKGARRLDDFRPIVDATSDHPALLDSLKQIGFYTDCFGNAHWSAPEDAIDQALATQLVQCAEILAPGRPISVRELELWVKHMAPVWNKSTEWMKTALVNWYADMQAEGLAPVGTNAMAEFVRDGLHTTHARKLGGSDDA